MLKLRVLIKYAKTRPRSVSDTSLHSLKALYTQELIRIDPHHAIGDLFFKLKFASLSLREDGDLCSRQNRSSFNVCYALMLLLVYYLFEMVILQAIMC